MWGCGGTDVQRPGFDGLLVLDKPVGLTSRDAVNRALGWFPRGTRIGHTGTLDPLATGVLVLCIGAATRLTEYIQQMSKLYRAGIKLDATSDTDDAQGTITPTPEVHPPTRAAVEQALGSFVGAIEQVPPAFSAARVTGRRAYDLARQGKDVRLSPRTVTICAIDVLSYSYPDLEIEVRCGKGTYIRSLARDLGRRLGSGGYIAALRRLAVGRFTEADAITLHAEVDAARRHLLPIARAVDDLPRITLPEPEATRVINGQYVRAPVPVAAESAEVAVFDENGRLLAVTENAAGVLHARKVFASRQGM
jgi:tRNA pseudouridine55 synthase